MSCPVALSIAGSDPSGGAGIQADLKTFCRIGVYGAAAVTCITVQNSCGVHQVHCLEAGLVASQVRAVLDDMPVSHIKTGMLGSSAIVRELGDILARFHGEVVVDPVLVSSSGRPLLDPGAVDLFLRRILPAATVLTPNLPELAQLAGRQQNDGKGEGKDGKNEENEGNGTNEKNEKFLLDACAVLFSRAPRLRAICVTGGHAGDADGKVTDRLVLRPAADGERPTVAARHTHPRVAGDIGHGTGCTFAAAFTAYHLRFGSDHRAFTAAAGLVADLLASSPPLGHGTSPLAHHQARLPCTDSTTSTAPGPRPRSLRPDGTAAGPPCRTQDDAHPGHRNQ